MVLLNAYLAFLAQRENERPRRTANEELIIRHFHGAKDVCHVPFAVGLKVKQNVARQRQLELGFPSSNKEKNWEHTFEIRALQRALDCRERARKRQQP